MHLSTALKGSVSRLCGFISRLFPALPHLLPYYSVVLILCQPCPSMLHLLFLVDDGCHLRQSSRRGDGAIRWRHSSLAGFWPVSESREPRLQSKRNETTVAAMSSAKTNLKISGLNQMSTRRRLEDASQGLEKGVEGIPVACLVSRGHHPE